MNKPSVTPPGSRDPDGAVGKPGREAGNPGNPGARGLNSPEFTPGEEAATKQKENRRNRTFGGTACGSRSTHPSGVR